MWFGLLRHEPGEEGKEGMRSSERDGGQESGSEVCV
jgi:hypothetical protein